jgi:hypothetical protein
LPLPAWFAAIVQVPAGDRPVVPAIVQIGSVCDVNTIAMPTGR